MDLPDRKKELRKILLEKLIKQILDGKFNDDISTKEIREYKSPLERDNYNYGYMLNSENDSIA